MLHKMSLRARLLILTAFSFLALLIAVTSAWRTAQMSQIFVERQAESTVSIAVRELLREARDFPNGRNNAAANNNLKRLPPHEKEIFANYNDPITRSTAIALHRFAETAGGFCAVNGDVQGLFAANDFGASPNEATRDAIRDVCRQIQVAPDFIARRITIDNRILLISAAPVSFESNDGNKSRSSSTTGAFALRRLPESNGFGDRFNLLTQGFLLISAIGLALFSFFTARDWQSGMKQIENGLRLISNDLKARISSQSMPELDRVSCSINNLAANLDENLSRQKELELSLAKNEKLAALGRVAAGVAHEVRNPLASMKLKIQLAERNQFETGKIAKTFLVLREEIDRLDDLVKKLLELSRPAKLNFSDFFLIELIEQRLSLLAEKAAAQNVRLEFKNQIKTSAINADRDRLAQVFDNLFRNALEAMPMGGNLNVLLEKETNIYLVQIADNGAGFSLTERERLFEPFFTTKDAGTGLGLTISREIIEAHAGKIYLLSDQTDGATFVIELSAANLSGLNV